MYNKLVKCPKQEKHGRCVKCGENFRPLCAYIGGTVLHCVEYNRFLPVLLLKIIKQNKQNRDGRHIQLLPNEQITCNGRPLSFIFLFASFTDSVRAISCNFTAAPGSGCDESGKQTILFRFDIPEPTSPGTETVVTSATLKLFARRRRRTRGNRRANSPTDDIVVVTVYQLNDDQRRHHTDSNQTEVGVSKSLCLKSTWQILYNARISVVYSLSTSLYSGGHSVT